MSSASYRHYFAPRQETAFNLPCLWRTMYAGLEKNYKRGLLRKAMKQRMTYFTHHTAAVKMVEARSIPKNVVCSIWDMAGSLAVITCDTPEDAIYEISTDIFNAYKRLANEHGSSREHANSVFNSEFGAAWLQYNECCMTNNRIYEEYETFECAECAERAPNDDSYNVIERGERSVPLCESCHDAYGFQCSITDLTFHSSYWTQQTLYDSGDPFCQEFCEDRGYVHQDDDGDWWTGGEPDTRLGNYHSAPRTWLVRPAPIGSIGVELEVGFEDNEEREGFLQSLGVRNGRAVNLPFLFEADSSLDDIPGGMEIISEPLLLHDGYVAKDAPWRTLLKQLYRAGGRGWEFRDEAGIHVNMDTRHEKEEDILKYAIFISNAAALSKFVSGRKHIFGHDAGWSPKKMYTGGYCKKIAKMMCDYDTGIISNELVFNQGKYSPVNRKNGYIETRIFGSNIKYEGFMATIEYCLSVMLFVKTRDTFTIFSPTISAEYRHWLSAHTKRFPNISSRLGITAKSADSAFAPTAKIKPLLEAA